VAEAFGFIVNKPVSFSTFIDKSFTGFVFSVLYKP
jgi:hypothetical protein